MLRRRARGEPLPYVIGWTVFRGLRLRVEPGGFVPRETTEFLVAQAIRRLARRRTPRLVDIGTGVGPVALAVAHAVPRARVHATDISAEALRQARRNARALGLRTVSFHRGDLFAAVPGSLRGNIDVITAHPPYVPVDLLFSLPPEVREHEPLTALADTDEGLGFARAVCDGAREWLRPGGWTLIEIGTALAGPLSARMRGDGYRQVRSTRGPYPYSRVLVGRR